MLNHRYCTFTILEAGNTCIAGTYRVKTFAHDHSLTNWLHALIWILKTYAIPAGGALPLGLCGGALPFRTGLFLNARCQTWQA
eukprot:656703-Pelagomonas_calceolata.AAC.1